MSELWLFFSEGKVEGWISFFWEESEKYLQLTGFQLARYKEEALAELLSMLEERFGGYTAYFGFPAENREAIDWLGKGGFTCIERSWNHSFFFDGYTPKGYGDSVERIFRHNFDLFRAVYRADEETYWTADRIYDALDDWMVFVFCREGKPIASVFLTGSEGCFEIFGSSFADGIFRAETFRELLTAALDECKRRGAQYLTYLCGEEERKALQGLGFRFVGEYVLYTKQL